MFSPYQNNGGTAVAVAGADYCILAADTRLSLGYAIQTRNSTKIMKISERTLLASPGMQADAATLWKALRTRSVIYEQENNAPMTTTMFAQLIANTLYHKRFFPYYTFNIVAGLDDDGVGCVYSYDAIGSGERQTHACQGSGQSLIQPLLDNQIGSENQQIPKDPLSLDDAIALVKDAFTAATERDINTGDSLEIYVMTKDGLEKEVYPLRRD